MILICTDCDLRDPSTAFHSIEIRSLVPDVLPSTAHADDVYFWRGEQLKLLKRRNAWTEVSRWLEKRNAD